MARRNTNAADGPGRRAAGQLENEVLAALWAADGPLTASQIQTRLAGDLADTTVMTILARLHAKNLVTRERVGRSNAYTPVRDEAEHTAAAMHDLLRRGRDRDAVLTRFFSTLSPDDEQLLHRLLDEHGER